LKYSSSDSTGYLKSLKCILYASKLDDEEMLALESDDRALVADTTPALAARTEAIEKELKPIMNDM